MSLPISLSGLGLPLAKNVAPAAYCGSKIQTLHLQSKILQKTNKVDETSLISDGKELFASLITPLLDNSSDMLTYDKLLRNKDPQHTIYLSICSKAYDDYVNDDKVSLRCKKTAKVGCGDNGHFLDVTLLNGMKMNSIEFRIACKLYLGFPVFYLPHRNTCTPCPCCKKGDLDIYGDHAIACAGHNDSSLRHNAVRDRLANAAQDGQFAASIEKRGVLVDGTESKPADVYIPLWNYGKAIAIDVCGASSVDFSNI